MLQFDMLTKKQTILVMSTLLAIILAGTYYYLIQYPKVISTEAYESVEVGQDIIQYLDPNSSFFQALELAKIEKLTFRTNENRICKIVKGLSGPSNDNYFLSDNFLKSECTKLCLNMTPSILVKGSFCIYLDEKKLITSKDKPYFWINYPNTK